MIAGSFPNMKAKKEILKWHSLPEGECDLNYRLKTGPADGFWPQCLGACVLTSVLTALFVPLIRVTVGPLVCSFEALLTVTIVSAALAVLILCGWYVPFGAKSVGKTAQEGAVAAGGVYLFWIVLAGSSLEGELAPTALLVFVSVPLTLHFADEVATHFVFMASANPRIDHKTMLGWQSDWALRFSGIPQREPRSRELPPELKPLHGRVLAVRSLYRWSVLAAAAIVAGAVFASVRWPFPSPGLPKGILLVSALVAALSAFAAVRIVSDPDRIALFIGAISSFAFYGHGRRLPPYVFQSPCGSVGRRRLVAVGAVSALTAGTAPLLWASLPESALGWIVLGLLTVVVPLILVLLLGVAVAGPVISAHFVALEAENAYEQHQSWRPVDGYTDRLLHSRNSQEKNTLFLGCFVGDEFPILLDRKLLNEHMHILGATGTGKTALGLAPLIIQLIRRNDGPVIIVDAKGDPFLMNLARQEAKRAGRKFKWFTNKPGRSTFIFNPFLQKHLSRLSLEEIVGVLLQCFNLFHGTDYGRAWFTANSHALFRRAVTTFFKPTSQSTSQYGDFPLHSMRHLHQRLKQITSESKEFEAAQHLALVVESLTALEQLNLSPERDPEGKILKHAIHMPEVIKEKQVIYFYLTATTDISTVTEVARLALFTTLAAAMVHKQETNETPKVSFICDEAQVLISQNLSNVMAQARSMGLSCVLAHQTLDQLNPPGGGNFQQLVLNCTSVKQWFAVRDPESQDYLSKISGKVPQVETSWRLGADDFAKALFSPVFAEPDDKGLTSFQMRMTSAERLDAEDISDINREQNQSVLIVERNHGYTQFVGPLAVASEYALSEAEYDWFNNEAHWPMEEEGTICIAPDGPKEIVFVQPAEVASPEDKQAKLKASRDQVTDVLKKVFQDRGDQP